jgi:hypothetical protein
MPDVPPKEFARYLSAYGGTTPNNAKFSKRIFSRPFACLAGNVLIPVVVFQRVLL